MAFLDALRKARTPLALRERLRALARRSGLGRFRRDRSGATAVEFAIIAAPFFAIMFATLQTSIIFFAGQTLETAVADASRLILTGQAQSANFDAAAFKKAVCDRVFTFVDCTNNMYVDVRTASSFSAASPGSPIDSSGNFVNNFVYQPGTAGDIVVVRAMYQWPVYVSLLGLNLANMNNGKRLVMASAAFRNEPF